MMFRPPIEDMADVIAEYQRRVAAMNIYKLEALLMDMVSSGAMLNELSVVQEQGRPETVRVW